MRCSIFVCAVMLFPFLRGAPVSQGTPGAQSAVIPCISEDGEKHYCEADTRYGARLVRQQSTAPCKENESWGYDEQGIWVDKGCGGEFTLGGGQGGAEPGGTEMGQTIMCASQNGRRTACPADTSSGVQLVRQLSDAKCKEGSSWGQDKSGIWVDKGCQAEFVVGVAAHPSGSGKGANAKSQRISCTSDDGRKNYCDVDTQGAQVKLVRQQGMQPCEEGSTWGYDRRGIWVDRGCRGEFLVQSGDSAVSAEGSNGQEKSCAKSVGKQVANELVRRCLQVTPATHPPCNAQNSCRLIEDEIQRGCGLLGEKAPAFCGENQ
jgi:peptide methionine sulfoxide reductase MsrB